MLAASWWSISSIGETGGSGFHLCFVVKSFGMILLKYILIYCIVYIILYYIILYYIINIVFTYDNMHMYIYILAEDLLIASLVGR
jgi:hypothetical protein